MTDLEQMFTNWVKMLGEPRTWTPSQIRTLHHLKQRVTVERGRRWIEQQKALESKAEGLGMESGELA